MVLEIPEVNHRLIQKVVAMCVWGILLVNLITGSSNEIKITVYVLTVANTKNSVIRNILRFYTFHANFKMIKL